MWPKERSFPFIHLHLQKAYKSFTLGAYEQLLWSIDDDGVRSNHLRHVQPAHHLILRAPFQQSTELLKLQISCWLRSCITGPYSQALQSFPPYDGCSSRQLESSNKRKITKRKPEIQCHILSRSIPAHWAHCFQSGPFKQSHLSRSIVTSHIT